MFFGPERLGSGRTARPTQPPSPARVGRAAWPGSVVCYCSIEGRTFLVLTDCPEFMAEVTPRLAGLRVEARPPDVTMGVWRTADDGMAILAGEELVSVEKGVRAARVILFQELVRRARSGREWVALVHAAAFGADGRCVLMPAASGSGKSTLAAALMASGFAIYSDDFAGIAAGNFQIPAMPFPIAIRRGAWDVLRTWIPDLDDRPGAETLTEHATFLPVSRGAKPASAVAIAFTEWVEGSGVSVQKLSTAEAIGRFDQSGFWVAHDRDSIGAFLAWLDVLPKFALRYGDLTDAVAQVATITGADVM